MNISRITGWERTESSARSLFIDAKKERLMPLFPIDCCRFLKSLLSHSKYFVKEETTLRPDKSLKNEERSSSMLPCGSPEELIIFITDCCLVLFCKGRHYFLYCQIFFRLLPNIYGFPVFRKSHCADFWSIFGYQGFQPLCE